jgi:hypothetical protein
MNPKLVDAWLRLMNAAWQGPSEVQAAALSFSEALASSGPTTAPDEFARWMARFTPAGSAPVPPQLFGEALEEWWRMMGFVPRSRYLELLERCELLQRRLQEAEATIQRLRTRKVDAEGQQILDAWETTLQDTLKAQAEWMRMWTQDARQTPPTPEGPGEAADHSQDR